MKLDTGLLLIFCFFAGLLDGKFLEPWIQSFGVWKGLIGGAEGVLMGFLLAMLGKWIDRRRAHDSQP